MERQIELVDKELLNRYTKVGWEEWITDCYLPYFLDKESGMVSEEERRKIAHKATPKEMMERDLKLVKRAKEGKKR